MIYSLKRYIWSICFVCMYIGAHSDYWNVSRREGGASVVTGSESKKCWSSSGSVKAFRVLRELILQFELNYDSKLLSLLGITYRYFNWHNSKKNTGQDQAILLVPLEWPYPNCEMPFRNSSSCIRSVEAFKSVL